MTTALLSPDHYTIDYILASNAALHYPTNESLFAEVRECKETTIDACMYKAKLRVGGGTNQDQTAVNKNRDTHFFLVKFPLLRNGD